MRRQIIFINVHNSFLLGGRSMATTTPLFISSQGGSITCLRGNSGRIFLSCSQIGCVYSVDLHSAKAQLDVLEGKQRMLMSKNKNVPAQRKTTLKWNSDGELSAVDMARILDRLANPGLTKCDLACSLKEGLS